MVKKSGNNLAGHVCLITGGSKGIGAAISRRVAAEGAGLAINYRNSEIEAKLLADEVSRSCGVPVICIKADVGKEEEVEKMFYIIESKIGAVSMLVNNAGIGLRSLLSTTSVEQWNRVMDTNLKGAFLCCRRALPNMLKNRFGRIVNIASIWGMYGASFESVYAVSKAGLIGLTRSLAKEVGPSGITVNAISPGPVATDMLLSELDAEEQKELSSDIPVGRLGNPNEIAETCVFLLSSTSFINGHNLVVDGGWKA